MISRRGLLLSGLSIAGAFGLSQRAHTSEKAKIVVVGGGYGGATAARTLAGLLPNSKITLVLDTPRYFSCPFSNLMIASDRSIADQTFDFRMSGSGNIRYVEARANSVDGAGRVILEDGSEIPYDRLILSPGIEFRAGSVEGYDQQARSNMPAAWGSREELGELIRQLKDMEDGGTVVMSVPASPYRCPPGPYERASLIAHYLKTQKPRSKLIMLDAKDKFSKMALFQEAWAEHYPNILEWRGASDDGRVVRVEPESNILHTDFEELKGAVVNLIPPQKAAGIAESAGVSDVTGWCPINGLSFESTLRENIYVIGDASIANPMPKSAFSANLHAKICAIAVSRSLMDLPPEPTKLVNTCYSFVTPDEAVSISAVYENSGGELQSVGGAGGITPIGADSDERVREAAQARDWFRAITSEAFG